MSSVNSEWELTEEKFLNSRELALLLRKAEELHILGTTKKRKALVRDSMLIHLAIFTGLRRAEICDLKVSDLRIGNSQSHLIVRNGKGSKSRTVRFGKDFKKTLKRYVQWKIDMGELSPASPDPYLLQTERSPKYSVSGIWSRWKKYSKKKLHAARHTFGTYGYQATKDLRMIQKQLGHSKITTTQIYSDVTPEAICDGMNAMEKLAKTLQRVHVGA